MTNRMVVATRKGLFIVERMGRGSVPWAITRTAFLAEHVIMTLPDRARRIALRGAAPGTLRREDPPVARRRRSRGRSWACLRTRQKPADDDQKDYVGQATGLEAGSHLVAGGRRSQRAGRALVRHAPRRTVSLDRSRGDLAACGVALVQSEAKRVVRRRRRSARHPLDLRRSARLPPRHARRLVRRRVGHDRRRRRRGTAAPTASGPPTCRRNRRTIPTFRTCTASCSARPSPIACGPSITTASSARPTAAPRGRTCRT